MSNSTSQAIADIDIPIMLFDGGLIGNPAKTAASAILLLPNGRRYTVSHFLFNATEMEAQYTGLIIGLRKAKQLGIKAIEVKGSSQWIPNYEQNAQEIQNHEILRLLYREAQLLIQSFEKISLEWIPSEQNRPAMTAISRCIGESISMEAKNKKDNQTVERKISPSILNFKRLGKENSLENYELLKSEIDDLTFKPLAQLRTLVSAMINENLTRQWKGNPLDLSEAYRWYLRGLPPEMALRKATLDAEIATQKLSQKRPQESLSPPTIDIKTTFIPSDELGIELPLIEVLDEEEEIDSPKTHFSPGYIDFDGTGVNEKETYICATELEWALGITDEKETFIAPESFNFFENGSNGLALPEHHEPSIKQVKTPRKDPVDDILNSISRLSLDEKTHLSKELLNSPDFVHIILKIIADRLT